MKAPGTPSAPSSPGRMGSQSRQLCLLGAHVDQVEGCVEAWGGAAALGPVVWAAYQYPQGGGG
eukprot:8142301-Pyramimonas_sp.AAC.1